MINVNYTEDKIKVLKLSIKCNYRTTEIQTSPPIVNIKHHRIKNTIE